MQQLCATPVQRLLVPRSSLYSCTSLHRSVCPPSTTSYRMSLVPRKLLLSNWPRCRSTCKPMASSDVGITNDPSAEVLGLWRNAQAVCFDVDSTLCEDESIDELAAFLGVGDQVAAMTANAMGGSVKFEEALAARLGLMNPSQKSLNDYLASHPPLISKGIPELIGALKSSGKEVFLVSGGFRAIINPIADILAIPRDHVFANTILFKENGSYGGFDATEFTSRSGGKAEAVRFIKAKYGYSSMVMLGDGATDLEARQPGGADAFIGYGGSVFRSNIAEQADWYVYNFQPLIDALTPT